MLISISAIPKIFQIKKYPLWSLVPILLNNQYKVKYNILTSLTDKRSFLDFFKFKLRKYSVNIDFGDTKNISDKKIPFMESVPNLLNNQYKVKYNKETSLTDKRSFLDFFKFKLRKYSVNIDFGVTKNISDKKIPLMESGTKFAKQSI